MMKTIHFNGSNHWLNLMKIEPSAVTPIDMVSSLQNAKIESRPVWKPMHLQPIFANYRHFSSNLESMNSKLIFDKWICLPSGDGMNNGQLERVTAEIKKNLKYFETR